MDRKLSYKKLPGSLELGVEKPEKTVALHQSVVSMPMTPQIPSAYRKEDGMLSYSLICVISGGTKRERAFLNELERKHTFKAVDVIFISTEEGAGGLTPKMMLSAYECICKDGIIHTSGRSVKLDSLDVIYMFTDVDHYENELKDILAGNECGIFTKAGDKDAFKQSIITLYENRELCKQYGKNGRQFVMDNLTREVGTQKYVDVIKSVVAESKR